MSETPPAGVTSRTATVSRAFVPGGVANPMSPGGDPNDSAAQTLAPIRVIAATVSPPAPVPGQPEDPAEVARSGKDGEAAETHVVCQQRVRAVGFQPDRPPELARPRASPAEAAGPPTADIVSNELAIASVDQEDGVPFVVEDRIGQCRQVKRLVDCEESVPRTAFGSTTG